MSSRFNQTLLAILLLMGVVQAQDWTAWRGPAGNGTVHGATWNPEALKGGAKVLWQRQIGSGHAAVAVRGDSLWTVGSRFIDDTTFYDVVYCLNAISGSEYWRFEYLSQFQEDPGPGATPVVDGNRLYALGREGQCFCLNAASGEVIWQRHLHRERLVKAHAWGFAGSPVIVGHTVLLNLNTHGIALDKHSGDVIWNSRPASVEYMSPVVYQAPGRTMAILGGNKRVHGVDVSTGKVQWILDWETSSDPVLVGHRLFLKCSGRSRKGGGLFDLSGSAPRLIWSNPRIKCQFQSYVVVGNYAYGYGKMIRRSQQYFQCIDIRNGAIAWQVKLPIWGQLIAADGHLIILEGQGRLTVLRATPERFQPVSSAQVVPMQRRSLNVRPRKVREECQCWTYPVLYNGKVFCRNSLGMLVCVDIR